MTSIIEGIEPAALWRNFETLTTIARPSRAEEAVIAHVREWAARIGLEVARRASIVTAVHAGLETALVGEKVAGLDMLSTGPQIEFPHSPDERVSIPTVAWFWQLLVKRAGRALEVA